MNMRIAVAAIAALAALLVLRPIAADEEIRSAGQIKFVSGGVGEESLERIRTLDGDFNLKLLFATRDGEYLADIGVTVSDSRGGRMLDTVSEGPWFLAKLVPGKISITAACKAESRTVATAIPAIGQREVVFRLECGD